MNIFYFTKCLVPKFKQNQRNEKKPILLHWRDRNIFYCCEKTHFYSWFAETNHACHSFELESFFFCNENHTHTTLRTQSKLEILDNKGHYFKKQYFGFKTKI